MIRKIEIERFSLTSTKPFDEILHQAIRRNPRRDQRCRRSSGDGGVLEIDSAGANARGVGEQNTEGIGKIGTDVIRAF